jgi:hypothetical protein
MKKVKSRDFDSVLLGELPSKSDLGLDMRKSLILMA